MHPPERNKGILLIVLGILFISVSQVISHYIKVSDFISGLCKGVGIGILIITILRFIRPKRLT
ncbi:hypothetical protein [Kordia sp.]|uniref:hypothetical protein n=1 Tax=Kordia sp. TaxID=1965332 RepID=UPI003B5A2D33